MLENILYLGSAGDEAGMIVAVSRVFSTALMHNCTLSTPNTDIVALQDPYIPLVVDPQTSHTIGNSGVRVVGLLAGNATITATCSNATRMSVVTVK